MSMRIGPRQVGGDSPLFVIAEIGLNHGGSGDTALAWVDHAARAGASAIKLQTLRATELVAPGCPPPAHVAASSLQDFFAGFELDEATHRAVAQRAHARRLAFMSTPLFDEAVDWLERSGCDAYKIASGDLTHHALIARAARTGKPLVLSTGMATLDDVGAALECARTAGGKDVALLHCVSAYPTPDESQNLLAIVTLARTFGTIVGLSDHGTDPLAPAIAVALGASIYERHFVADPSVGAIDAAVSMTPPELEDVVLVARHVKRALGDGGKHAQSVDAINRTASRRGVYARRSLRAGQLLGVDDLVALRPETGVPASRLPQLVGTVLAVDVPAGEPLPTPAAQTRSVA